MCWLMFNDSRNELHVEKANGVLADSQLLFLPENQTNTVDSYGKRLECIPFLGCLT